MPNNSQYLNQLQNSSLFSDSGVLVDESVKLIEDDQYSTIGGAVTVLELNLQLKDGSFVSLLDVYSSIIVEESVFTNSISGAISVIDPAGGLEKFMIRGGENLRMKIAKPNNGPTLIWRQDLIITLVGGGNMDSLTGYTSYTLHFAPRTYINSLKTRLYKSYKDQSLADAVLSIYDEISANQLFIEDPKITLKNPFISTGFMPHRAIDELAQRACSKNKYFAFFERFVPIFGHLNTGSAYTATHYFGSMEKLIEDSKNLGIKTISFNLKLDANFESPIIRARSFSRMSNFNHLPAMDLGFYNTKITSINPITKEVFHQKMSYTDSNEDSRDFYANKLIDRTNIFSVYDDIKNQIPGNKLIMSSINDAVDRKDWLKNHIYGNLSRQYFKILVEIQGATNRISAGHVVNFVTPSFEYMTVYKEDPNPYVDPVHSGSYFVVSVIHTIAASTYTKKLELARSSSPINPDKFTSLDNTNLIQDDILKSLGNRRT